jgi:16S rRNA (guanine527-N7)-methyltransferase
MKTPDTLIAWLNQNRPDQADELYAKFKVYQAELIQYNQHTNLTRIDEMDMEVKHFLDCLTIEAHIPPHAKVADVGSGAGFPGMVLALVRPDCHFDLIEATGKRCQFLRLIKERFGLDHVQIHHARVEELIDGKNRYDVVSSRAVARLNVLLELCIPLLKIGGTCIAMKGSTALEELEEAQSALRTLKLEAPQVDVIELAEGGSHINLIFTKTTETPAQYPRSYAAIKKKAL